MRSRAVALPLACCKLSMAVSPPGRAQSSSAAPAAPKPRRCNTARRGQGACPGGGADQREPRQIQPDGVGRGALADDDVDGIVLHSRVQDLLHRPVQPVYLVHEQQIVCFFKKQDFVFFLSIFNSIPPTG